MREASSKIGIGSIHQTVVGDRNVVTGTGDIYLLETVPPIQEAQERFRLAILQKKVRQFWIDGVLRSSLPSDVTIDLGAKQDDSMIESPWERVMTLPSGERTQVIANRTQYDLFTDAGRALLILGEPGSGKTINLLFLTRELLDLCQADFTFGQPIPIVLNLSSWSAKFSDMSEWLVFELSMKYHVPRRIGWRWLKGGRLVPMLDGLDEVKEGERSSCITSINAFIESEGLPGIAVTSRCQEYISTGCRLRFGGAIYLEPPTDNQIERYLSRFDAEHVSAQLGEDPELYSLARSPLMLNIMVSTFGADASIKEEVEISRDNILGLYITRTMERSPLLRKADSREATAKVLEWVARGMREHNRSQFFLEELQPSWLTTNRMRILYFLVSRLSAGLVLASAMLALILLSAVVQLDYSEEDWAALGQGSMALLGAGLLMGVIVFILDLSKYRLFRPNRNPGSRGLAVAYPVIISVLASLVFDQAMNAGCLGVLLAVPFGIFLGLRSARRDLWRDIFVTEAITWSWKSGIKGGLRGFIFGTLISLLIMIIFMWDDFFSPTSQDDGGKRIGYFIISAGISMLLGTVVSICGFVFGGIRQVFTETKSVPNQGMLQTLKSSLVACLAAFVISGLLGIVLSNAFHRILETKDSIDFDWEIFIGFGMPIAIFAAIWYGALDILHHLILRVFLALESGVPFRMAFVLDMAVRTALLQKVGSGYIFLHRMILENFAERAFHGR